MNHSPNSQTFFPASPGKEPNIAMNPGRNDSPVTQEARSFEQLVFLYDIEWFGLSEQNLGIIEMTNSQPPWCSCEFLKIYSAKPEWWPESSS